VNACRHAEREIKQLEQDYEDEHARFKARGGEIDRLEAEVEQLREAYAMAQAHVRNVLGSTANGWINLAARDEILRRIRQDEDEQREGGRRGMTLNEAVKINELTTALEYADKTNMDLRAEVELLRAATRYRNTHDVRASRIDAALAEADAALEMFEERSGLEEVVKALKGEA